ncbi:hypothetical protein BN7_89 [Wickerhamomyces ciferrii]|uniref:Uncharacterized protein n=1 Tax=Wickerhamomyces ciferrii (strain ATCC 14091 / BCRC 22168 / CBS 111 / JCM 3599 / NBRC 0793 / NRRL Y-1031 F-60-10) TaxID=1206466 RepID=K0KCD3_WICCF|nr:uncharacterized protein BN7_89 [Wickerhamomyces ciferrii]CCH40556.1 hypothetical protein BN7_89 [Wickerhamomyces ciferrii]
MGNILEIMRNRATKPRTTMKESVVTPSPSPPKKSVGKENGYESEIDDSESDNDLDPLTLLSGGKTQSIAKLTNKRSNFFENKSNNQNKKLKLPPKPKLNLLKNNNENLNILKKSDSLQKLHMDDQTQAINELNNETPESMVCSQLNNPQAKNDLGYIEYLSKNIENLKDFQFWKEPIYTKPLGDDDIPLEIDLIPGIRQLLTNDDDENNKFDIFNELNIDIIQQEISKINKSLEQNVSIQDIQEFMNKIGGALPHKKITNNDLKLNPMLTLQSINLLILKFKFLVSKVLLSDYSPDKFELIIKIIGLIIMDQKFYINGEFTEINSLLLQIIKWKYYNEKVRSPKTILNFNNILEIWFNLTNELKLFLRFVEVLDENFLVLSRLKKNICLNVFLGNYKDPTELIKIEFTSDDNEFQFILYDYIISKLVDLNNKDPDSFQYNELSKEFICLFKIFSNQNIDLELKSELKIINNELNKLRNKITTSFKNSDQASFKSLLLLITTLLSESDNII